MTAREKFRIGDRVRLSIEGKRAMKWRRNLEREGEITRFVRTRDRSDIVLVKFDRNKNPSQVHGDFLELATSALKKTEPIV